MGARIFYLGFIFLTQTLDWGECLVLTELTSPYKVRIQSSYSGKYLTTTHQGILGLKTGSVTVQPYQNRHEQQWTLVWDPSLDNNWHDGYRLESRKEFLNEVTSYYPDGSTIALPNIWEVIELKSGAKMFRSKRTRKCLHVKRNGGVTQKPCVIQNDQQHWKLKLLDVDARIGERRYRVKNRLPLESEEQVENDSQEEEDDLSFEEFLDD